MVLDWPKIETRIFRFRDLLRKTASHSRRRSRNTTSKSTSFPTGWTTPATTRKPGVTVAPPSISATSNSKRSFPSFVANCRSSSSPRRARDIRNAVEFCDKQKLKMILAGGAEAYKVKELLRSKSIPVILQPTLTEPLNEDDPYDRSLTQPAELADAHVKFAFGSFDNSFARRLGQQAANAVALRPALRRSAESSHALPRANLRPGRSNRHARNRQNRQRHRHQRRPAGAHHRRSLPLHQGPANVHRQQTQIPLRQISKSPNSKVAPSAVSNDVICP